MHAGGDFRALLRADSPRPLGSTLLRRAPQPRAYDEQQAACECRRREERAAGAGVASRGEEHDSGGYDQDAAEHALLLPPEKEGSPAARTAEI